MSEKKEQTGGRNTTKQSTNGTRRRRPNSHTGTNSTSICQIIEACGRNGVGKISLADGTTIEFISGYVSQSIEQPIDYSPIVVDNRKVEAQVDRHEDMLSNSRQIEMELDDLALNDPMAYEILISNKIAEGISND